MSARHRRLVLLDVSSSDREVPLPRSELIRQVAVWEVRCYVPSIIDYSHISIYICTWYYFFMGSAGIFYYNPTKSVLVS